MSAAAEASAAPPPAKGGKKKLIIIIAAVVLLLAAAGGGAVFYLKKKAAAEAAAAEADGEGASAEHAPAAHHADPAHPPTFVPLDPFVVNLADKEVDKYAQVGITLEVDDAHFADQLKAYMPAIRNGILLVLAHKTSQELLTREGKDALAAEVMRESVRPLGIEIEDPEADSADSAEAADGEAKPKAKKKKKKAPAEHNPVTKVHFSSFIVQ